MNNEEFVELISSINKLSTHQIHILEREIGAKKETSTPVLSEEERSMISALFSSQTSHLTYSISERTL